MLKNKWLTVIALTLFSLCVMVFAGCTLEGDIETLREKVNEEQYSSTTTFWDVSDGENWFSDRSISSGATHTYRFYTQQEGYSYWVAWLDSDAPNNSNGFADIKVAVKREGYSNYIVNPTDGKINYGNANRDIQFGVFISGYIIIEVYGNSSGKYEMGFGSYEGIWSTSTELVYNPVNATALYSDTWTNGTIASCEVKWYSFYAYSGTTYYFWVNDIYGGDGSKTLDIEVHVFRSNGDYLYINDAYSYPASFYSSLTGTIYLGVRSYDGNWDSGTYAIAYNTSDTRPGSSGGGGGVPSAPAGVNATATSSSSITVSWDPVSDAASYDVYYEIGSSTTKIFADNTTGTSYTHTGLTANTTYYYYIKAKNSAGDESAYSSSTSLNSATTWSSGYSSGPIDLAYDVWHTSSLSPGTVDLYRFYANVGTEYYVDWYDYDNSSFSADIKVGVKREGSSSYTVEVLDSGNYDDRSSDDPFTIWFSTAVAGYYIIEVHGYSSNSSGSYRIKWSDY